MCAAEEIGCVFRRLDWIRRTASSREQNGISQPIGRTLQMLAKSVRRMCDSRHCAQSRNGRHSPCRHGLGSCNKTPFEPGGTKRPWKGEAAACFVSTGIASSRALPTSSAGYWSPRSFLVWYASASGAKRSSGGDFFARCPGFRRLSPPVKIASNPSDRSVGGSSHEIFAFSRLLPRSRHVHCGCSKEVSRKRAHERSAVP